jgi:predicted O-linked N-acetylglucosamine transferase (SPINDLY family)
MAETSRKHVEQMNRVLALASAQRFEEARLLCLDSCRENGNDYESWFLLGALNGQLGRAEEAIQCCQNAIKLQPDNAEAYFNLAQAFRLNGQISEALESYRKVLALDPFHRLARDNLVATLRFQSRQGQINKKKSKPSMDTLASPATWLQMGNAAREKECWGEALAFYHEAININPNYISALRNLGLAYQDLRAPEESVKYFDRALAVDPDSVEAHFMLGNALRDQMKLSEAVAEYEKTLSIQPDYLDALHNIGITRVQQGDVESAVGVFRQVLESDVHRADTRSCLLMNLNYLDIDSQDVYQEHLEWVKHHGGDAVLEPADRAWEPERTLNIGYVSPDFRAHSVAFFLEPLLEKHGKSSFKIFCYSDVLCPDFVTRRLQPLASIWRDVRNLSEIELAKQIQADGIDILVDLAGHTANNRMGVFTYRPAPIQVSWLGYPNTTGLSAMDYRLTDIWVDPPGETESLHTEKLVRLPDGFLCYDPHNDNVTESLSREVNRPVTFGSFNNLAKVTPDVISVWSAILKAVPDARLLLKTKPLRDVAVREHIYSLFLEKGIARDRVELTGWVPGRGDHLGLYCHVDIGLDTFPYNGTTTTCEALWMGVPVITLAGHVHAGRVGASLLSQIGLTELIASDRDEYVALAAQLARDRERLAGLHSGLRNRVAVSPLCDAVAFAGHVESAYRKMWRDACEIQNRTEDV